MRPALFVIAGIMAVVGLIWVFQGLNVIKGSFMTGQILWTYIGIVMLVLAGGLAWFTNRKILK